MTRRDLTAFLAALRGSPRYRLAQFLLAKGAPLEALHEGLTPLQRCALVGNGPGILALLEAGADPSATADGWTAAELAEAIAHEGGDRSAWDTLRAWSALRCH